MTAAGKSAVDLEALERWVSEAPGPISNGGTISKLLAEIRRLREIELVVRELGLARADVGTDFPPTHMASDEEVERELRAMSGIRVLADALAAAEEGT